MSDTQQPQTEQFQTDADDAQTFTFEEADIEMAFTVTDSFENRYGDLKAVVDTPAPWEVDDEMTAPNDLIKSLDWQQHHYQFDSDRKAWTMDVSALRELESLATEAGYEWSGQARSDTADETFVAVCEAASEGDDITVQYAKKNGNGSSTYAGTVTHARAPNAEGYTPGIAFADANGKTKRVRLDDNGVAGLFSGGYHPFMGTVEQVELRA